MYQLGVRPHHRRNLYLFLLAVAVVLIIGGTIAAQHYFQADTSLSQTAAVTRHVDAKVPPTKPVTTPYFTMTMPRSWQADTSSLIPSAAYAWRGTGDDAARRLEIYIDSIPADMAVNRLLPLGADGSRLMVGDDVSDNCVNFTDDSQADARTGRVLAKWSGVTFYCDTANYLRDVVGTGSSSGRNTISLHGDVKGTHRYFFVYTDNSASADYSIFTDMLRSLRAR